MRTVHVLNGPNLNLLGRREPAVYGSETLADVEEPLRTRGCEALGLEPGRSASPTTRECWSTGSRSAGPRWPPAACVGAVLNAGAYTHTSVARARRHRRRRGADRRAAPEQRARPRDVPAPLPPVAPWRGASWWARAAGLRARDQSPAPPRRGGADAHARSRRSASAAASRRRWTPPPRPASTASRSSSPTWWSATSVPRRCAPARPGWASASTSTSPSGTSRASTRTTLEDNLRRAEERFRVMNRLGVDTDPGLQQRGHGDASTPTRCPPPSCAGSATSRRRTASGWRSRRWPGALHRRLPPRVAGRRARRPPRRRHLSRQLPHPLPRSRPGGDRADPRRQDLLRPARGRAAAVDGRAVAGAGTTGSSPARATSTSPASSVTSSAPATPARCRWRSSTTRSARPTPAAPRSTPCVR